MHVLVELRIERIAIRSGQLELLLIQHGSNVLNAKRIKPATIWFASTDQSFEKAVAVLLKIRVIDAHIFVMVFLRAFLLILRLSFNLAFSSKTC